MNKSNDRFFISGGFPYPLEKSFFYASARALYGEESLSRNDPLLIGDQLVEAMNKSHQLLLSLKSEFDNAVKIAYANGTSETAEGKVYHIEDEEYELCKTTQSKIEDEFNKINGKISNFLRIASPEEKKAFQEKTMSMGKSILAIRNQSRSTLSEHSMGLEYYRRYPTPESRRHSDWNTETEMNNKIMFGY